MYLLVGSAKAALIDTGDVGDANVMPLAQTVLSLLPGQADSKLPLVVLHTHGHLDHRSGDAQFQSLPGVHVVSADLDRLSQDLRFIDWPNGISQIDLGDRVIDAIPTPGHHVAHVVYYDRQTALFFSGDFLLPGRLLIEDADAEIASARRVADFVKDRPVSHVLGGHIELDEAGDIFWGTSYHPNERRLDLNKEDLLALPDIVAGFNGFYNERGGYLLINQNRMLLIFGFTVLLAIIAVVLGVRRSWVRRKRRQHETGGRARLPGLADRG